VINAVFFDWFGTLAHYDPPREEVQSQVLQELGFNVSPEDIRRGLLIADKEFYENSAASAGEERSPEERARLMARYQERVLSEAGVDATEELVTRTRARLRELLTGMSFAPYHDVLPTLKMLKERNLTLGLLTNWRRDLSPVCRQLGMEPYLDFALSSGEVGAEKPHPTIFRLALEQAGVTADEAIHVGDQYTVDVVGARSVGIMPILIDRADIYPDVSDCPRIRGLTELMEYLN